MTIFTHHPTGPRIKYVPTPTQLADQLQSNMRDMVESYVNKGGLCTVDATLPCGKVITHKFSIPAGLDFKQVDAYIAIEADYLDYLLQNTPQRRD